MKNIETFSVDERVCELLRRYAQALGCSKSMIVEDSLKNYFEQGGPADNLSSEYKKKSLRLEILQKQELVNAFKGGRSVSLKECGERCDNE